MFTKFNFFRGYSRGCLWVFVSTLVLAVLCGCAGRVQTTAKPLNQPARLDLMHAAEVRFEVFSLGNEPIPEDLISRTIERFERNLAGKVVVHFHEPLHADEAISEISREQMFDLFNEMVDEVENPMRAAVFVLILPHVTGEGSRGVYRQLTLTNSENSERLLGHFVTLKRNNLKKFARKMLAVGENKTWELVLYHELGHALNIPYDKARISDGHHCKNPSCVMYQKMDMKSVSAAILRLGPPREYCKDCQAEIAEVLAEAPEKLHDEVQFKAMDMANALVRLNPGRVEPIHYRYHDLVEEERWADAMVDIVEAHAMSGGGDDVIMSHMVWMLGGCPERGLRDYERGYELGMRLCERTDFQKAYYLEITGINAAGLRNYDQAIALQKRANQLRAMYVLYKASKR